ncbi:MAG TPA: Ig-like domain-containing protein, partial [Gemmatimonadales bacterium]|nr:Ig-like domain-containing protein [Gemmatimonadales bacterium]
ATRAAAQVEPLQALRKTDLIRLLTSRTTSRQDVAARVRLHCLSFVPTSRDRADLVQAGADSVVLAAIADCAPRSPTPVQLLAPARVFAITGSEVRIIAQVVRGNTPVPKVSLVLRGVSAIPGGNRDDPTSITNARGAAPFRFLAGLAPGTYRLQVASLAGIAPEVPVELVTTLPSVVRVDIGTPVVTVRQGSRVGGVTQVHVTDDRGRPVPGLRLSLEGITAEFSGDAEIPTVATDDAGNASLAIPGAAVRRGGQVGLLVGGTQVATFTIVLEAVALHPERTQFMGSFQVRGVVGTQLVSPVVFQVRDTAGLVVPGYPVTFTVQNGSATPGQSLTDANGVARAIVTLGERSGPVVITARAGRVSKEVTLYATPAEPEVLIAERGGEKVTRLDLTTRDTVALRVVTRDHFGNEAAQSNLRAQMFGGAAALRETRTTAAGTVVLMPRRNGTATLQLQSSGLVTTVPITVLMPVSLSGWIYDARLGGAAFNYGFKAVPGVSGKPGFRAEVAAGRLLGPSLRVEGGLGIGMLRADAPAGNVTVVLYQGLVRGEYAFPTSGNLTPVLSLGGGVYRIKSTDPANVVYHTSLFYAFGGGVDYALGYKLIGTVRLERQQLVEANSKYVNGSVGAVTLLEVGLRVTQ